MARHSAPRRDAPARTWPSDGSVPRAAHRSAIPASTSRYATSAIVAAATLTGGALVFDDHSAVARADDVAVLLVTGLAPADSGASAPAATDVPAASIQPVGLIPATSTVTVAGTAVGDTAAFDAIALVKAVTLVETQRAEAEAAAAAATAEAERLAREAEEERARGCAAGDSGFGAVRSHVREAGIELRCRFGVESVLGVAGRANASDHPAGLALDLMVDRDPGEDLAEYAADNMDELGISYVIYWQRINFGSGWEAMEDRGGVTANHMDHVHISFER